MHPIWSHRDHFGAIRLNSSLSTLYIITGISPKLIPILLLNQGNRSNLLLDVFFLDYLNHSIGTVYYITEEKRIKNVIPITTIFSLFLLLLKYLVFFVSITKNADTASPRDFKTYPPYIHNNIVIS